MNQCLDCDVLRLAGHFPFNTVWSEENARKMRVFVGISHRSKGPFPQKTKDTDCYKSVILVRSQNAYQTNSTLGGVVVKIFLPRRQLTRDFWCCCSQEHFTFTESDRKQKQMNAWKTSMNKMELEVQVTLITSDGSMFCKPFCLVRLADYLASTPKAP